MNDYDNQEPFNKGDADKEQRYARHWEMFVKFRERKEQKVRFLSKDGIERNIYDYVRDSVDRMNEVKGKPEYKEDWQNNVFDPITRDKVIAILSRMAAQRMRAELVIKPNSIFDTKQTRQRRQIFQDLLDAANRKNKDALQLIWEMFQGLSEGTVFGYEGWKKDRRRAEFVVEYNPDTGEKKTETREYNDWDDVYGEIVPLEEMFPETIWVSDWRKVHKTFRAREMFWDGFKAEFGKRTGANNVQKASQYFVNNGNAKWGIPADTHPENVFVLEFFDDKHDKYGLWANGVELYYGCLPWNHKRIPFWHAIAEPIHLQFLFGKSLPDRLMGMQDIDNALFNAMLDQLFLALNSPIVVAGQVEDMDDGYLEMGRTYQADVGTKIEKARMGVVDPAAQLMLQNIKRSMDETGGSAQSVGVPTGGRKTKYEVQQLQEGALTLAGLFLQLMEHALSSKYELRMANILQYYAMPRDEKNEDGGSKFKYIELDNTTLDNGRTGKKMIQIVNGNDELPSREKLLEIAKQNSGEEALNENGEFDTRKAKVQPVVITRDYLLNKNYGFEVKMVPNSSVKDSEVEMANRDIAFANIGLQRPDLFDQEMVAQDLARAFKKPEDIVKVKQQQPQQVDGQGQPGAPGRKGLPPIGGGGGEIDLL